MVANTRDGDVGQNSMTASDFDPNYVSDRPGLYFTRLEVENVRCFGPRQTLDLTTEDGKPALWTVILSENGGGKTTLLQCLSQMWPKPVDLAITWADQGTAHMPRGDVGWLPGNMRHNLNQGAAGIEIALRILPSEARQIVYLFTMHFQIDEENNTNFPVYERGESINFIGNTGTLFGYGATRRSGLSAKTDDKERGDQTLFNESTTVINAEKYLISLDYASLKDSRSRNYFNLAKDVLIRVLPDINDIRITDDGGSPAEYFVEFSTPYGWLKPDQLSLGYRTTFSWMIDFVARLIQTYPDSPNPLAEPAVCLIDEIDLHMHPRWQREIVDHLAQCFPRTQFIVTAHSPLVVQSAENANIVVLRREGDHVIINNDPVDVRDWRLDQIYTSELFGLESARPRRLDAAIKEREDILRKNALTKTDRARLEVLNAEILPGAAGETRQETETLELLNRLTNRLKDSAAE